MSDTGPVTTRASFFAGPLDGGELTMHDPLPPRLDFPMNAVTIVDTFAKAPPGQTRLDVSSESAYTLVTDEHGAPWADCHGRVRYAFQPQPKETPDA